MNNSFGRTPGGDCLVRLIPAREKIRTDGGLVPIRAWERIFWDLTYTKVIPPQRSHGHMMEHAFDLLEGLGVAVPEGDTPWARLPPELWITEADRRWAEEALSGLPEEGLRVALFPSARFALKLWPVERYAATAKEIARDRVSFVLLGGEADESANRRLLTDLTDEGLTVCDLTGRMTLRQLVAVIDACDMYLGSDTAALHVATALGLGTVCPMAGGQPGRFYPWGDPELHRAVLHRTGCYGCNWRCPHPEPRCMMGISVEEVAEAFVEVRTALDAHGKKPQGRLYVDGILRATK